MRLLATSSTGAQYQPTARWSTRRGRFGCGNTSRRRSARP